MVTVQTATLEDAQDLARHMRALDRQELWSSDRRTPAEELRIAMSSSEVCRSLRIDGEVAAIWGVRPVAEGVWLVWALTGKVVDRHPVAFWRTFKTEVFWLLRIYPVLCNMVDARYPQAVETLRRAGFKIEDPVPWGPDNMPFHFCIIRRGDHAARTGNSTQEGGSQAREERETQEAKGRYLERGARPLRVRHHAKDRMEAPT